MRKYFSILLFFLLLGCNQTPKRTLPTIDTENIETGDPGDGNGDDTVVERPSGALSFDATTSCACLSGIALTGSHCDNYCAVRNTANPILYLNGTLGSEIMDHTSLGSLTSWCSAILDENNPSCVLELYSTSTGQVQTVVDFNILDSGNTPQIQADLTSVGDDTYIAYFKEVSSAAISQAFQFTLNRTPSSPGVGGPLIMTNIASYVCLQSQGTVTNGTPHQSISIKNHFYYSPRHVPQVNSTDPYITCETNTTPTSLIDLDSDHFYLWSENDARFGDLDNSGSEDIEDTLNALTGEQRDYFFPLSWPNGPSFTGASTSEILGFVMYPFLDSQSVGSPLHRTFCPSNDDFSSSSNVMQSLSLFLGVETEALYLAKREDMVLNVGGTLTYAADDYIFITRSQVEDAWFYYDSYGSPQIVQDDDDLITHEIMFYYPVNPDPLNATTPIAGAKLYKIKHPSELASNAPQSNVPNIPLGSLGDRKIGCVPKIP